jgi:hypothetical protein
MRPAKVIDANQRTTRGRGRGRLQAAHGRWSTSSPPCEPSHDAGRGVRSTKTSVPGTSPAATRSTACVACSVESKMPGTNTACSGIQGIPEVGADNATRCAKARAQSGDAAPTWSVSALPFASPALPLGASAPWPADRCIAERSRRTANGRPLAPQLPMPRVQPWSLVHRSLPFVAPCRVVHRSAPLLIVVARRNERRVVFAAPNVRRLTAGPPSPPASCPRGSPCSARRR